MCAVRHRLSRAGHGWRSVRLRGRRRPLVPEAGRGRGRPVQGRRPGATGAGDLQEPRLQLDSAAPVSHAGQQPAAAAQRSRLHHRPGPAGAQRSATSSCSTSTTPTPGPTRASSSCPRRGRASRRPSSGASRLRVHARLHRRLPRGRRDARHGADRQRGHATACSGRDGKLPDNWDNFAELVQAGHPRCRCGPGQRAAAARSWSRSRRSATSTRPSTSSTISSPAASTAT